MSEIFIMGGWEFMSFLTVLLFITLFTTAYSAFHLVNGSQFNESLIAVPKSLAIFALVVGCLGQFIGLYGAFEAIEQVGSVSQSLLASGLKISSITTIYGMLIMLIGYLCWFLLGFLQSRK